MLLKADIPIELLQRCTLNCEGYNHPANCMCKGSGIEPTMLGYELIRLIQWLIRYAPQRLTNFHPNGETHFADLIQWAKNDRERDVEELRRKKLNADS